jgi:hypothetical protein
MIVTFIRYCSFLQVPAAEIQHRGRGRGARQRVELDQRVISILQGEMQYSVR